MNALSTIESLIKNSFFVKTFGKKSLKSHLTTANFICIILNYQKGRPSFLFRGAGVDGIFKQNNVRERHLAANARARRWRWPWPAPMELRLVIRNDAVFYRTYPLLYHKFENMVIFRWKKLYSLCSPGNQEYQKIIFFSPKRSKSTMQKLYFYWN